MAQLFSLGHIATLTFMLQKPDMIIDGCRVTIDGEEILVIRCPFSFPLKRDSAESREFERWLADPPFPAVVAVAPSGVADAFFGHPRYTAKFDARKSYDFQWTKVPVFLGGSGRL